MNKNIETVVGETISQIKDIKSHVQIFYGHADEYYMDMSPEHEDGDNIVWIQYIVKGKPITNSFFNVSKFTNKEKAIARFKTVEEAKNFAHKLSIAFKMASEQYPNIQIKYNE
jgi:hypothetical protein